MDRATVGWFLVGAAVGLVWEILRDEALWFWDIAVWIVRGDDF